MTKFTFYYWAKVKRSTSTGPLIYPWRNLIEFPGFRVVSWLGFLILMLPLTTTKYKGNPFVLNMGVDYKKE